jgi:hypothetical protein
MFLSSASFRGKETSPDFFFTCYLFCLTLISGFCRDVDEICGLLGYYAASCGDCLPTFRDNLWVPFSSGKKS